MRLISLLLVDLKLDTSLGERVERYAFQSLFFFFVKSNTSGVVYKFLLSFGLYVGTCLSIRSCIILLKSNQASFVPKGSKVDSYIISYII